MKTTFVCINSFRDFFQMINTKYLKIYLLIIFAPNPKLNVDPIKIN